MLCIVTRTFREYQILEQNFLTVGFFCTNLKFFIPIRDCNSLKIILNDF